MASRFQELFRLPPKLFVEGSPVLLEAGALLKDTQTLKVLAQLKFRNLSERNITACKISIRAYEPNGKAVEGIHDYSYLDIDIGRGHEFGAKVPVYLPNNASRSFSAAVTEVVFKNGEVWSQEPTDWQQVPPQAAISEILSDRELQRQYQLEVGGDAGFVPSIKGSLFLCACGAVNLATTERCHKCQRTFKALKDALDLEALTQKKDARIQKEVEKREAEEKAATEAKVRAQMNAQRIKQKTKRVLKILLPMLLAIALLAALTPEYIKPAFDNAMAYRSAHKHLSDGSYDEAMGAFEQLGTYRDASDMVLESQYQKADSFASNGHYEDAIMIWKTLGDYSSSAARMIDAEADFKEANYVAAVALMENREYTAALEAFLALDGYKDSTDKHAECIELQKEVDYEAAIALVDEGNYAEAVSAFKEFGSYKEAARLHMSTSYLYALELSRNRNYKEAINYFTQAKGYEDADVLKIDAIYNYARKLLSDRNYSAAITQFLRTPGHKDTASKLLEAKYGYVKENLSNTNNATHTYLNQLVSANYSDAKSIYAELYAWKVEVTATNTSSNSTSNMSSISKYSPVCFHFKLTGGNPGSSILVTQRYTFPDGSSGSTKTSWKMGNGDTNYLFWDDGIWENPAYGATGTMTMRFYDEGGKQIGAGSVRITN